MNIFRSFVRASAFLRAEIFEILRQPRLVLTLVLGPFLILLLFGLGFRSTARALRTLFVVESDSQLAQQIEQMAPQLGPQLVFKGVTTDKNGALARLRADEVDVVAVAPPHAYETLRSNQQATFVLYHHEVDPTQVSYVQYFGQVYIDEVNRRVLNTLIREGTSGVTTQIDPNVLVSPFKVEAKDIAPVQPTLVAFFAPAVIVLLLQHLAITFAALSIVRERMLGTMELFRVSPLSALETLVGKYLSYLLFGGILAALLTAVLVYGLQVPMLGDWRNYALVIAALLFASLGIGFVLSLLAQNDSQAVQYAMLVLLATVFFSGFFMRLDMLWQPVRAVSWALPATYSILLLQDVMLRGPVAQPWLLAQLAVIGVIAFILALLLLRRRLARV